MDHISKKLKYKSVTKRWGGIRLQQDFDVKLDNWLSLFSIEEQQVLLQLLQHYNYYTENRINKKVIKLYDLFKDTCIEDTVFTKIYKNYGVGFSDVLFTRFWLNNSLYDFCEPELPNLLKMGQIPSVIAIVDDYLGTGDTIMSYINSLIEIDRRIQQSKIYFLVIQSSTKGYESVIKFGRERDLQLQVLYLDKSDKAFSENFIFNNNEVSIKRDLYSSICKRYNVNDRFYFGYNESEELLSFSYNTPNNTLGIFWNNNNQIEGLFYRHKKENTNLKQMQNSAKKRQKIRQIGAITYADNDFRYNNLMIYFCQKGTHFSYEQACRDFGFTKDQMDKAISYLISENYLEFKHGKVVPTKKMNDKTFKGRMKAVRTIDDIDDGNRQFEKNAKYIPNNFKDLFSGYNKKEVNIY